MSSTFKFKEFIVRQEVNSHKVGTDSMILGAWTCEGNPTRILDIGTGTGVLALMMAQNFPEAQLTAIETNLDFLGEAIENFKKSTFHDRILAIHSDLQSFGSMEKFDLIICNPPYFNSTFKSESSQRNQVRQDDSLAPHELFEALGNLLAVEGKFNVIVPFDREEEYVYAAHKENIHPNKIIRTLAKDGTHKRSLISFSFDLTEPQNDEICIRMPDDRYSNAYITLTEDYHAHDLRQV